MHQIQKDKFHVISPEAFSPKPMNEVQKRLQAILDYWGPNGEQWGSDPYGVRCHLYADGAHCVRGAWTTLHKGFLSGRDEFVLEAAAKEAGFHSHIDCSDSSFENARKMVLRAIALAGEP